MQEPHHKLEHAETEGRPLGAPRASGPARRNSIDSDASRLQERDSARPTRSSATSRLRNHPHTETR